MHKATGYQFSEDEFWALKSFFDIETFKKDRIYTAAEIKNLKKYAPIRLEEIYETGEYWALNGLLDKGTFENTYNIVTRIKKMKPDVQARLEKIFSGFDDAE